MTTIEKKRLLEQYRDIEAEIQRQKDEYNRVMTAATRITPVLNGMPRGGNGEDRIGSAAERLVDIEKRIANEVRRLCRVRERLLRMVNSVEESRLRLILNLRYIDGIPLIKVADKVNYSYMQTRRLLYQALEKIKDVDGDE
ncbi:MAG TPA: hypothetical protein PLU75_06090 [Oscillospiraceae bacterium]|nr:hypothetical protein [Oscillospiraceae bacterium]